MTESHPLLQEFRSVIAIPVQWGEQDSFGHVNNVVYMRWAESGRVDYLRHVRQFPELPPRGVGPILVSVKCDYRKALHYPDTVYVGSRVKRIGKSSFQMVHKIVSKRHGIVAAELDSTLILLDYARNAPVPLSREDREKIAAFEGVPVETFEAVSA